MEPAAIPVPSEATTSTSISLSHDPPMRDEAPFPISAIQTPSDIDMIGTPIAGVGVGVDEGGSDAAEEEDGLFAGGDDEEEEEEESDAMEEVQTALGGGGGAEASANGVKRKLVEEDDYD